MIALPALGERPGQELQVDFAQRAWVMENARPSVCGVRVGPRHRSIAMDMWSSSAFTTQHCPNTFRPPVWVRQEARLVRLSTSVTSKSAPNVIPNLPEKLKMV